MIKVKGEDANMYIHMEMNELQHFPNTFKLRTNTTMRYLMETCESYFMYQNQINNDKSKKWEKFKHLFL
jgi:hypothetical protein